MLIVSLELEASPGARGLCWWGGKEGSGELDGSFPLRAFPSLPLLLPSDETHLELYSSPLCVLDNENLSSLVIS